MNIFKRVAELERSLVDHIEAFEDKYKECRGCGGVFATNRMKKVIVWDCLDILDERRYYCKRCSPDYDRISIYNYKNHYYKDSVVVTKDGKIIKESKK